MHPVVYYTVLFAIAGAAGMAIAGKKAKPAVRKQRWLKYFMYILITGTVITSMFLHFFIWLSLLVTGIAVMELLKVNVPYFSKRITMVTLSFVVFLMIAAGFVLFAQNFDPSFQVFIYFQVLVFDGFCQVTGQLWGKHQLVPSISPAKTVEGLIGGWLCGILAAILAAGWIRASLPEALLYGLFTGLAASAGDLLASFYKRKVQVKDYSNWLPGQGGFLDRFDSFLMTGFAYFIIYMLIFRDGFSVRHF